MLKRSKLQNASNYDTVPGVGVVKAQRKLFAHNSDYWHLIIIVIPAYALDH